MAKSDNMQRINLEVDPSRSNSDIIANVPKSSDPYSSEIEQAQKMLEELRIKKELQQREEEKRRIVEEKRAEFVELRNKVLEKLENAIPNIDQELLGTKQEISDLESAKKHFTSNLKTIEAINPDRWEDEAVVSQTQKFQSLLSKTSREYEQFASILSEGRGRKLQKTALKSLPQMNSFGRDLVRGLAFSLPLIITIIALFIFLV